MTLKFQNGNRGKGVEIQLIGSEINQFITQKEPVNFASVLPILNSCPNQK